VVIPLYLKHGREFPNLLRGMFSFVLYDARDDRCAASPSIFIAITSPYL
jgi:asparagine synthetase B (glutamine-hydrolysing)